jgi:hypothetical protein
VAKGRDTWLASEPHKLLPQRFGIDQAALVSVVDRPLERDGV